MKKVVESQNNLFHRIHSVLKQFLKFRFIFFSIVCSEFSKGSISIPANKYEFLVVTLELLPRKACKTQFDWRARIEGVC